MRPLLLLLLLTINLSLSSHSIAFVYLGKKIPKYAITAVDQALLFNDCEIFFLGNKKALKALSQLETNPQVKLIAVETLPPSNEHEEYRKNFRMGKMFKRGFWLYTTERFFYLGEFMKKHNLQDVIHMECDNLIYRDLNELMPIFHKHYKGIGATFDNDNRCIAGLVYIANFQALENLNIHIATAAKQCKSDMYSLGSYLNITSKARIDSLPITTLDYTRDHKLSTPKGKGTKFPQRYTNHVEEFNSIFDAAAIGQYIGGIDPIHRNSKPGFINESCVFNPSKYTFIWKPDAKGRWIPYAVYKGTEYKLNNMHVHCKILRAFSSKHKPFTVDALQNAKGRKGRNNRRPPIRN